MTNKCPPFFSSSLLISREVEVKTVGLRPKKRYYLKLDLWLGYITDKTRWLETVCYITYNWSLTIFLRHLVTSGYLLVLCVCTAWTYFQLYLLYRFEVGDSNLVLPKAPWRLEVAIWSFNSIQFKVSTIYFSETGTMLSYVDAWT